jgi:hypothetical protein
LDLVILVNVDEFNRSSHKRQFDFKLDCGLVVLANLDEECSSRRFLADIAFVHYYLQETFVLWPMSVNVGGEIEDVLLHKLANGLF